MLVQAKMWIMIGLLAPQIALNLAISFFPDLSFLDHVFHWSEHRVEFLHGQLVDILDLLGGTLIRSAIYST